VRHFGVQVVHGTFESFEGTIVTSDDVSLSSVVASVDTASVDSQMAGRDEAIRSPKLFDTNTFPMATYSSTGVRRYDAGVVVDGMLTLLDTAHPLTFFVDGAAADDGYLLLAGRATFNRHQHGVQLRVKPAFLDRAISRTVQMSMDIAARPIGS
jgi:polyisoprenoid-binding protein YceI